MKRFFFFLFIMFFSHSLNAQDNGFRPTYVCDGYIKLSETKKLPIKLNYLVLLDSTIVGSYFYTPSFGTLKLTGKLNKGDSINRSGKSYPFSLEMIDDSRSYWSYIRKFRDLPEYQSIQSAVRNPDKVVAFDIGDQAETFLLKSFAKLKNVLSINIGGNRFKAFPVVISELQQLQELSMSSNGMEVIRPEIGNLKELRILIINFNKLKKLPVEIGNLKRLLYLELGNNQLKTLPLTIANLQQLQELHIERNKLSDKEKAKIKRLLPNCIIHFD
ncbi:Leucine Rich repeats (2 copies) [compost metagenome]